MSDEKQELQNEIAIKQNDLNKESLDVINRAIAEKDPDKSKDLTYLFNITQNKKTMVRVDKLNNLLDLAVDQVTKRIETKPDELSNAELITSLKVLQDLAERGQKQINGVNDTAAPLIQINQQNNEVNVADDSKKLSRESRNKVKNAVFDILNGLGVNTEAQVADIDSSSEEVIEADVTEHTEEEK